MKDVFLVTLSGELQFSDEDGHNAGTIASNQFHAKDTIHAIDHNDNFDTYVPFHSVIVEMETTTFEQSDAVDANCD